MPIINKTKRTAAIYNRGREVVKVYDHGKLAWQKSIPDYLCFTALEAGQFTLTIPAAVTTTYLSYVEWSKDGRNWNRTDVTSSEQTIEVSVVQDDKVYWRGRGNAMSRSYAAVNSSRFSSDCQFNVSGNLMSLLTENFETVTSWRYTAAFASIFNGCTTLISAKDMTIPLTTLGASTFQSTFAGATAMTSALTINVSNIGADCFNNAFEGCSSLVDVSGLKMTLGTLPNKAFYCAFLGCSSLVLPPPITFTSLDTTKEQHCYRMFDGCTSLTSSFLLMPATLATSCYQRMFYNCSSLAYIKCLATDISATNCLTNWLGGVSSTGTFIQAEGVEWPRGASGIPTGWLAYDEGEEIPNDYAACDYIHITRGSGMVTDVLADKSTYGCELEYNFTQNELDAAANNNIYIPLMYYVKTVTTDPDFPKQICGQLYLRYNADWLGWQRNAGIYTYPTTGKKTVNSSALIIKRPAVTGWHYIRCAATTTDDNFICLFDDEISQTGKNYYPMMNENPTDEPAEIYISCRNSTTTYPIDNGGDMKYFKIIHPDGETIVADYVPCVRKSDNVAGFWDKVGLVFKSSFGTPFVAGYNQT